MNILKKILVNTVILISLNSVAQSNKPLIAVFKQSYEYEATKNYEAAINVINSLYSESSYEINLRLAWLYYLSGKQKESVSYYQKAVGIMPVATEPLWGMVNAYAKQEDWSSVEKTYLNILKIDPKILKPIII